MIKNHTEYLRIEFSKTIKLLLSICIYYFITQFGYFLFYICQYDILLIGAILNFFESFSSSKIFKKFVFLTCFVFVELELTLVEFIEKSSGV